MALCLASDALLLVCRFLEPPELLRLEQCCRAARAAAQRSELWRELCQPGLPLAPRLGCGSAVSPPPPCGMCIVVQQTVGPKLSAQVFTGHGDFQYVGGWGAMSGRMMETKSNSKI